MPKDVVFSVKLYSEEDKDEVRDQISRIKGFEYEDYDGREAALIFRATKSSYEKTFKTRLLIDRRRKNMLCYTQNGYTQDQNVTIPDSLETKVKSVFLNKNWKFSLRTSEDY